MHVTMVIGTPFYSSCIPGTSMSILLECCEVGSWRRRDGFMAGCCVRLHENFILTDHSRLAHMVLVGICTAGYFVCWYALLKELTMRIHKGFMKHWYRLIFKRREEDREKKKLIKRKNNKNFIEKTSSWYYYCNHFLLLEKNYTKRTNRNI